MQKQSENYLTQIAIKKQLSSLIHNSQDIEITQMSIDRQVNKKMGYIHTVNIIKL